MSYCNSVMAAACCHSIMRSYFNLSYVANRYNHDPSLVMPSSPTANWNSRRNFSMSLSLPFGSPPDMLLPPKFTYLNRRRCFSIHPPNFRLINHSCSKSIIESSRTLTSAGTLSTTSADASQLPTTNQRSGSQEVNSTHEELHPFKLPFALCMMSQIIAFIWRIPGIIAGLLKKEKKFIDTVEEEIDNAADVIKVAAKVVEEVAEGLEKVAKAVENDAERVDTLMDKVKEKTKAVHDNLEEAVNTMSSLVLDKGKSVAKVDVKVSKEDTITTTTITHQPPPPTTTSSTNATISSYKPFQSLIEARVRRHMTFLSSLEVILGRLVSLKSHLIQVESDHSAYGRYLKKAFVGTIIMAFLFHVFGFMATPSQLIQSP